MSDLRAAVLIDGGFLRVEAKKANKPYNPDYIEQFALICKAKVESLFRILYYDCALYNGTVKLPVSGNLYTFQSSDAWLHELSHKDFFAVRRGVLKFADTNREKRPYRTRLNFLTLTSRQTSSKRAWTCG